MWSSSGQCPGQGEGEGARLGLFKATAWQGLQEAIGNGCSTSVQWAAPLARRGAQATMALRSMQAETQS